MVAWFICNLVKANGLSFGLILVCLSAGSFILPVPKQVAAQTAIENDYSVPPSNPKTGEGRNLEEYGAKVPEIKSPNPSATVNPIFYKPNLPPLGASSVYLPSQTEALGIRLIVKLSDRKVYVYKGDKAVTSYRIAVGKPGWETPAGTYQVFSKEVNPTFKSFKTGKVIRPGPDNPLGIRWIGIWTDGKTQLGFHGTNQPELIGEAVSHGCIRMRNKDVLALFEQVSVGTPVTVEP